MENNTGTLEIIMGPMFSGKTELLISKHSTVHTDFWNWCIHDHMKPDTKYYDRINFMIGEINGYDSSYEFHNAARPFISLAVNYHKDTRYGDNQIASHNGNQIASHNLQTLSELFTSADKNLLLNRCMYVFINEAQFFPDLKESVIKLVEQYNKHVVICGLDSDFKREKFGKMWELMPYADTVTKLKGKCDKCKNPSLFTHRVTTEQEQEVIGTDSYIPLCRKCYLTLNA